MTWSIRRRRPLAVSVALALLLLCRAVSAYAGPIMVGAVTVTETDSANPPTTDNVTIGAGPEISSGDTTNIGAGILLSGEYIDIGQSSYVFNIYGGGTPISGFPGYRTAGYPSNADYTFSNISFDVPGQIVGLGFALSDIANFTAADLSFTADSIIVHVGSLGILDSGSPFGRLTVNVETRANQTSVPEPSSMSMLLLGLGLMAGWSGYRGQCVA